MKHKDIAGTRFSHLSVISYEGRDKSGSARWNCVCDCGAKRVITGTDLRAGRHKSCGCKSPRFKPRDPSATPAVSSSRTYRIWIGMQTRCSPSARGKSKRLYFDRGIRVCDAWLNYETFLGDMGHAPDGLSLDRIDGSRGYEPGNCRWATAIEQANNTSANRHLEHDGRRMTVAQWAAIVGIRPNTLEYRILRGWSVQRALTAPRQKRPDRSINKEAAANA